VHTGLTLCPNRILSTLPIVPPTTKIPDILVLFAVQLLVCLPARSSDERSTAGKAIVGTRMRTSPSSCCVIFHHATQSTRIARHHTVCSYSLLQRRSQLSQGRLMSKSWNKEIHDRCLGCQKVSLCMALSITMKKQTLHNNTILNTLLVAASSH
jgi:hypothetical protein